jgi:hypothetical protein
METPYTDENRIEELNRDVRNYMNWVSQFLGSFGKEREIPLKEWISPTREWRMTSDR